MTKILVVYVLIFETIILTLAAEMQFIVLQTR